LKYVSHNVKYPSPTIDFMPPLAEGRLEREQLAALQRERLIELLSRVLPRNCFYAEKFARAGVDTSSIRDLTDLPRLPFTTKAELLEDQAAHPPYGTNLTCPLTDYVRHHQTSGTTGQPLRWLDTAESWAWMLNNWMQIYAITGITPADRLFFAFSFGPFLGFWTAFEAAAKLGCLCLPGGGMSSAARLRFLLDTGATVVLCTPTYALHLAEVARDHSINLAESSVRALIVAGEPGGCIPATRARIESSWGARLFDHSGMTEIGPCAVECQNAPGGLHVLERDYLIEVIDPATAIAVPDGTVGELVVTNFGRWPSPLIRYRTGDLVRVDPKPCPCGLAYRRLDGGILGRSDELIHVRGNNVYPSALEAVLRDFAEIAEYRIEVDQTKALASLRIEVEPIPSANGISLAESVAEAIRERLLFRAEVATVATGTLPRFELKAKRIVWKK
jgi:phenylacetate-CoA ligase